MNCCCSRAGPWQFYTHIWTTVLAGSVFWQWLLVKLPEKGLDTLTLAQWLEKGVLLSILPEPLPVIACLPAQLPILQQEFLNWILITGTGTVTITWLWTLDSGVSLNLIMMVTVADTRQCCQGKSWEPVPVAWQWDAAANSLIEVPFYFNSTACQPFNKWSSWSEPPSSSCSTAAAACQHSMSSNLSPENQAEMGPGWNSMAENQPGTWALK